jgi:hypothetical protein
MRFFILSATLLFGECANAQTFTAAELSGLCSSDRRIVVGYVAGVIDKSDRAGSGCLNRISASISGALPGLGCQAERQRGEVGLIRGAAVKARMWPPAVVKVQITTD